MSTPSGQAERGLSLLQVVEASGAGVGRHVRNLCVGLVALGNQVAVAYASHRADEAFKQFVSDRRDEIRFIPLDLRREVSPASDLRSTLQLLRVIKHEGPFDVVHGHSSKGGAVARIAGRWCNLPTVYTPHSLILSSPEISRAEAAVYTFVERALGNWATSRFIAVSEDERAFALNLKLVPDDRVVTIENALDDRDFEDFCKLNARENACEDLHQKPLTFGSVMRFSTQKAPGHLIEAFVRLSKALPDLPTRLVIAGDGELFTEAKRQVEMSGMSDRILLLGWRTDARDVLRGLDIFVLSSLYEGLSYSLCEAMAAGLPVVSTSVFGTRGILSRLGGNVLVPVGSPVALSDGMKRMATLASPALLRRSLQRVGQANRHYALKHFRQTETTQRTFEVYRELL